MNLRPISIILALFFVLPLLGWTQGIGPGDGRLSILRDIHLTEFKTGDPSYLIRSFSLQRADRYHSQLYAHGVRDHWRYGRYMRIQILPVEWRTLYNSHFPYGQNNGALFESRGLSTMFRGGFFLQAGPLSVQLYPELHANQNRNFDTFPVEYPDAIWQIYAREFLNRIDNPARFTEGAYTKWVPGHSSVRLNYRAVSAGVSTEYLWWGPGVRNALLLTNNAEGFPHFTVNTRRPANIRFGHLEFQYILGQLKSSDFEIAEVRLRSNGRPFTTTKRDDWRLFTGLSLVWHPPGMSGFAVGAGRTFIGYGGGLTRTADYFPLFQPFQKDRFQTEDNPRGNDVLDQRLSLFFRYVLPKSGLEVYGEFGREDHAADIRDIVLELSHSRAYVLGVRKKSKLGGLQHLVIEGEITRLHTTNTSFVRPTPTWYVHHIIRHGTTHRGQLLGAAIGPGSNSNYFAARYTNANMYSVVSIDVVHHNMDLFKELQGQSGVKRNYSYTPGVELGHQWKQIDARFQYHLTFERNRYYFPVPATETISEVRYFNPNNHHVELGIRFSL